MAAFVASRSRSSMQSSRGRGDESRVERVHDGETRPTFVRSIMRPTVRVLIGSALAVGASAVATPAHAQAAAAKGGYVVSASAAQGVAYSSRESDFVAGKTVYLRSNKTLVGTIEKVDANHAFPPSFPSSPAKAVLIRRKDRSKSWAPVEGITRLYVVNK
jgi:hypothetical protein